MFNLLKTILVKILPVTILLIFLVQIVLTQKTQTPILTIAHFCADYQTSDFDFNIASDNDKYVFIPYINGTLVSVNSYTFQKLWEANLGGEIISKTLSIGNKIFIATQHQTQKSNRSEVENINRETKIIIHSLDKLSGITEWQVELNGSDNAFLYSYANDIIVATHNGEIYSISKYDGKINWQNTLASEMSAIPYRFKDKIMIGTKTKQLYILALSNGSIARQFTLPETATVLSSDVSGESFITGDQKGNVRSVKIDSQSLNWRSRQGAEISSINKTQNGLLVTSFDNFLYLFSEQNGDLIWKRRMAGRVTASTRISDGYFVSVSINEPTATIINVADGKILNKITLENGNFFSGDLIRTDKSLIFATRSGIISYSLNPEGCRKL